MRKNRLIALIGTLTMAAAGLAAVSAGVSSKEADSVSAYGKDDTTWFVTGDFNSWNKADSNAHLTYSKDSGNNWEFASDNPIGLDKDSKFNIVYSWNSGAGYNTFTPDLLTNSTDFTKENDYFVPSRNIKVNFYLQIYGSGASWTGLYWSEVKSTLTVNTSSSTMGSVSATKTSNIAYKENVTITATPKTGYHFVEWNDGNTTASRSVSVTDDVSYTATFAANTDTEYAVKHYKEDLTGGTYTLSDTDYSTGTTGANTAATAKSYEGFTAPSITQQPIAGDGSTVINLNYTRNSHTLTWDFDGGSTSSASGSYTTGSVKYGTTIVAPNNPTKNGFVFNGWSASIPATMPDSDVTITATWIEETKTTYQVRWLNGDGSVLKTEQVEEGTVPSYSGTAPTKAQDTQYTYAFSAWSPTPSALYAAQDFTPTFTPTLRGYTITWKNGDGTTIETDEDVKYGDTPTYNGSTPTKTPTTEYSYTWDEGWTPAVTSVTGDATYVATFESIKSKYTISWNVGDGTITSGDSDYTHGLVEYGTAIVAPEVSKPGYELASWSPALGYSATVTGDQEFVANYRVPAGQYIIGGFNSWAENATGVKMSPLEESGAGEYDRIAEHVAVNQANEVQMIWVSSSDYAIQYKNAYSVTYYNSPSGRCVAGTKTEGDSGKSGDNAVLPIAGSYTIKTYKDNELDDKYRHYAVILEEYKLEFNMGGHGTAPNTEYALYNEAFAEPIAPAKDGNYTFAGWYTDTNYATEFDFTTAYNANKVAYAKWNYDSVPVTISFNTNGGTTISPISGNSGQSYSKPADPTKTNHIFAGWTWSGQTTPTNLPDVLPDAETEYTANWTLESGTYLAIMPNGSSSMPRDGQLKFDVHQGTQLVVKGLELHEGDQIRPYFGYGESDWNNINSYTWSHPDYAVSKSGDNVLISEDGIYDIYFTYDTCAMHVSVPAEPENGRYLVVNGDTSKDALKVMSEHSGYTGTEFLYNGNFAAGDKISAYYQDSSKATQYYPELNESVKVWEYVENEGLVCPEDGNYSIYLISEDGGDTYNKISIFKEGEADANEFAKNFLSAIKGLCEATENINDEDRGTKLDALESAWDTQAGNYGELSNQAKQALVALQPDQEGNPIQQFLSLYDYTISRYNDGSEVELDNFLNRTVSASSRKLISISDVSTSTWIIATVAVVGIAAVGVFFIYRKRKEI